MFVAAFHPHRRDSVSGDSFVVMVQVHRSEIGIFCRLFKDTFSIASVWWDS
jgi:hypothetical protein